MRRARILFITYIAPRAHCTRHTTAGIILTRHGRRVSCLKAGVLAVPALISGSRTRDIAHQTSPYCWYRAHNTAEPLVRLPGRSTLMPLYPPRMRAAAGVKVRRRLLTGHLISRNSARVYCHRLLARETFLP